MTTRSILKRLLLAVALLAANSSRADDNPILLMVVDATGKSIPTATVHVMVSNGPGEKDYLGRDYPADRNGVVLIPMQSLPKKPAFWAWCADAPGYDGVSQNQLTAGGTSNNITATLKTIKYPRHCSLVGKPGYYLLNPPNAPRVLYLDGWKPKPTAPSGPAASGHMLK